MLVGFLDNIGLEIARFVGDKFLALELFGGAVVLALVVPSEEAVVLAIASSMLACLLSVLVPRL